MTHARGGRQGGDERREDGDHDLHDALQGFLGAVFHGGFRGLEVRGYRFKKLEVRGLRGLRGFKGIIAHS